MTTDAALAEPAVRNRARRRRSELTPRQGAAVAAIALTSACAAVFFSSAAPTGSGGIDAAYRVIFAVLTVLAGSRARRWSLLIASALVTVGSDGWAWLGAALALVTALVLAWQNRRDRVIGAVVGALIGTAALHLSWPASPTGATAVLAGLAVVPLWISGYRVCGRSTRRRLVICCVVWIIVCGIGMAAAGLFAFTRQSDVRAATADTIVAAGDITSGNPSDTAATFTRSAQTFDDIAGSASAWWMIPARLVPIVAQNVTAVRLAAVAGAGLNTTAAELAGAVDYDSLQLEGGRVDLAVLSSYRGPLRSAAATVAAADDTLSELTSPWLVAPLQSQLDRFATEVGRARSGAAIASDAAQALPGMLGADGPRRYLLLLGNPAEARDLGGHLGNWAEILTDNGKVDVVRVGTPYELFGPGTTPAPTISPSLELPPALVEMNPTVFPQNWGASPDLHEVAALAADLYPQSTGGAPIDGVLYADPTALAALLSLTGPVELANGTQISAENAVQYLTVDQFASGENQNASVSELVQTALDRLTDTVLPSPARLAAAFGPVVDRGNLQFVSFSRDDSDLLRGVGLETSVTAPDGGDLVAVINRNANPSKIDAYLSRTVDYSVRWNPENGRVTSRLTVTMTNAATDPALPPVVVQSPPGTPAGTNRTQLSVLTPFNELEARLDGAVVPVGSQPETGALRRYSVLVDIPPGESRTVSIDLSGKVTPGDTYHLRWITQPLLHPDVSRLLMRSTGAPFIGGSQSGATKIGDDRVTDLAIRTES